MSYNSWNQTLVTQQVDGPNLQNSAVATSIIAAAAKFTLPAGLMLIGQKYNLKASGIISTLAGTPGTLSLAMMLGGIAAWTSGAIALNTAAQSNASWRLEVDLTCRSIGNGTGAQLIGSGDFKSRAVIGSATLGSGPAGFVMCPETAPSLGNGFDSTVSELVDFFGTWSVASASNSLLCNQFDLTLKN